MVGKYDGKSAAEIMAGKHGRRAMAASKWDWGAVGVGVKATS